MLRKCFQEEKRGVKILVCWTRQIRKFDHVAVCNNKKDGAKKYTCAAVVWLNKTLSLYQVFTVSLSYDDNDEEDVD